MLYLYYSRALDLSQAFPPKMGYDFCMLLIEIIKQTMQENGLSQQSFADILGVFSKNYKKCMMSNRILPLIIQGKMGIKSKTHFHTPITSRWWKCAWLEQVTSCPLRKALITLFRDEISERR